MTLELTSAPPALDVPVDEPRPPLGRVARTATALIVGLPFAGLLYAIVRLWGHGIHLRDLVMMVVLYLAVGHGVTIGYHRLLTHRSFTAKRPLKVALIALGSMAFEGGPIGWVASHRRHHAHADRAGDPHSPHAEVDGGRTSVGSLWHAHLGWLFTGQAAAQEDDVRDLRADPDVVLMDRLFPLFCVVSLAIPFGLGWLLGGSLGAGLVSLLWAGLVRVCLLHHATWSVNSLCHTFGRRPFSTRDESSNMSTLALVSMGESWHNGHHAFPNSARHGLLPGQLDTSALLIGAFERLSWAGDVRLPTAEAIERRRNDRR